MDTKQWLKIPLIEDPHDYNIRQRKNGWSIGTATVPKSLYRDTKVPPMLLTPTFAIYQKINLNVVQYKLTILRTGQLIATVYEKEKTLNIKSRHHKFGRKGKIKFVNNDTVIKVRMQGTIFSLSSAIFQKSETGDNLYISHKEQYAFYLAMVAIAKSYYRQKNL